MTSTATARAATGFAGAAAPAVLDELDLALVDAVLISPRASWAALAPILDVDPATLSRRWARLSAEGAAWVTCHPGGSTPTPAGVALVELDCHAGSVARVADTLARDPQAVTVELLTGDRDILVTAAAPQGTALTEYVLDRIPAVDGVRAVRTTPVVRVHRDTGHWRPDALDRSQRAALRAHEPARAAPVSVVGFDRELLAHLAEDGRMSYAELSVRTGQPQSTVRARVRRLLDSGTAVLRGDAAHSLLGWPIQAHLWLSVPTDQAADTARALASFSRTRMCSSTVGAANLTVTLWLHRVEEVQRLEAAIVRQFPKATVVDRALALRVVKRVGRILDPAGRAVGHVPPDLWTDAPTDPRPRVRA
ncbi:Lrp/AsnC family transcriptional regulator [Yinghuangia seranimata]|uniref:Lrp/AsnC family transcriptional regulator n=1 Tax=Yinghuangia seranimata TaxID=408067 RepID=UPI00248B05EE|nr:Lrp/AsnC family transcriptional regulator [Yinghuangia seranimata]MDI2132104.1 Lrp/AsnC family transcriptional regulator [Yinghuangia seranimata]